MPLSQIIDYDIIQFPHSFPALSRIEEIKRELNQWALNYTGSPIIIPENRLPLWYNFLIFEYLSNECPEIVYESSPGKLLLLFSAYTPEDNLIRPQTINRQAIFNYIEKTETNSSEQINFNLSDLNQFSPDKIEDLRRLLQAKMQICQELIFSGEASVFNGLTAFTAWRPFCEHLFLMIEDKKILIC